MVIHGNMDISTKKRDFRRAVRDVVKQLETLGQLRDVEFNEGSAAMARSYCQDAHESLVEYDRVIGSLEELVADEAALAEIVTDNDEEKRGELRVMMRQVLAEVAFYEAKVGREKEERERQEAREDRLRYEERDERLRREEWEREDRLAHIQGEINLRELQARSQMENQTLRSASNLPKIDLVKFDGNPTSFQEWWDNFNSLIHSRTDLDRCRKFHYLNSVLTGQASRVIKGIRITTENYQVAIDLLKEKFGVDQIVVSKLYDDVMNLKPKSYQASDLHTYYCELEVLFRLLDNHICDLNNEVLITSVLRKIPTKLQEELYISKGIHVKMNDIRTLLNQHSTAYECMSLLKPHTVNTITNNNLSSRYQKPQIHEKSNSGHLFTGSSLVVGNSDIETCVFCNGQHTADSCREYVTCADRQAQLGDRCFICLRRGHRASQCMKRYWSCQHCQQRAHHNSAICPVKYSVESVHVDDCHQSHSRNTVDKEHGPMVLPVPTRNKGNATFSKTYRTEGNKQPSMVYNPQGKLPLSKIHVSEGKYQNHLPQRNTYLPKRLNTTTCAETNLLSSGIQNKVYLQTATVYVQPPDGKFGKSNSVLVRIVLDTGSSSSYISQRLFEKLQLKRECVRDINVFTFGEKGPKGMTVFGSKFNIIDNTGKHWEIEANVVPTIVGSVPTEDFDIRLMTSLSRDFELADCYLTTRDTQPFDILIGNDYYLNFLRDGKVHVGDGLYLLNTLFGYVLSGKLRLDSTGCSQIMDNTSLLIQVDSQAKHQHDVSLFWSLDTLGIKEDCRITDDDIALQNFDNTLQYKDGRYSVSFPWRDISKSDVQTNFGLALGRLNSVLKRHKHDGILETCKNTFEEQLKLGILEPVQNINSTGNVHYLPFHPVFKKDSEHTKVRFVMDPSCRQNKTKPSLNELLYRGPVLLENLCSILIRFRLHRYGVIADLEKAFLNIGLNTEDRDFTRLLWVKDVNLQATGDNLQVFRHTRIPFGITSSPFLLMGVINHHLSQYPQDKMVSSLRNNLYVDNLVCGIDSDRELKELVTKSRGIFKEASLNLRQWSTSCKSEFIDQLPTDLVSSKPTQNVLGLDWNTENDTLHIKNNFQSFNSTEVTKRTLLSLYGSFYDVMGLWSPVTVSLKLMIQDTWLKSKHWDEKLDESHNASLLKVLKDFQSIPTYPIQRQVSNTITGDTQYELHAFSDACMTGYGTCVYLRCITGSVVDSKLLFSKVRIAPVTDKPTLVRLELLGSLIACRSLIFVYKTLEVSIKIKQVYLWTDNQCVLHWILGNKVLPVFVKNRVNEIKSNKLNIQFRYVPTKSNPADILCRGENVTNLVTNSVWWSGPDWLCMPETNWPNIPLTLDTGILESEVGLVSDSQGHNSEVSKLKINPRPAGISEDHFSSFGKLIRVTCYVLKFIKIMRGRKECKGTITVSELEHAKLLWLRYLQSKYFSDTIHNLNHGQRDSLARNLGLNLSSEKLLICKGRFLEVQVTNATAFPILLPRKDHITNIIVSDIHAKCYHMGTNTTLNMVRREYWIPQGRTIVKSILHKCVVCKKLSVGPYMTPEFSFYPDYRVNKNVAFSKTVGMDYFGPLYVKENKQVKSVFGLIFSCLTVRAVHFELVDFESTSDLVLAFRRFLARCGSCEILLCDNAPQFRTLRNVVQHIQSVFTHLNSATIQNVLSQNKVHFQFIPTLSPWAGGCYERLISVTKQCLRKGIGKSTLTYRQLETVLTEVQYVVNSRPLGYCSDEDLLITPNHFLGIKRDSLLSTVENIDNMNSGSDVFRQLVTQWKTGKYYLNVFWNKWYSQYLHSLRERSNVLFKQGKTSSVVPKVGDVVVIKVPKQGRFQWPFGQVVQVQRSRDGEIRSCSVRQSSGRVVVRPVSLLFPFECQP